MTKAKQPRLGGAKVPYDKLFWIFMAGSVLGFLLEGLWCVLRKGVWENHVATVWGPLCLVYGVGAAAIYWMAMYSQEWRISKQFWAFGLAGSLVEYFTSLFQEVVFGSRSWDYSEHYININGRVSLRMTIMWGMLGVLFVRWALPFLQKMLGRMQGSFWHGACVALSCWMVVNLLVTGAALSRWQARQRGEAPGNRVEESLDERFGDERMEALFCNMVFQ